MLVMILDSHFHSLTMAQKNVQFSLLGVIGIDIGTVPYDILKRKPLIGNHPLVYLSQGAGPWCLDSGEAGEILKEIEDSIEKYGGSFLGEVGLDYHWKYGTKETQRKLFESQIGIASRYSLPVIIHSRDADEDMIDILSSNDFPSSGIMHSFSSSPKLMEKALEKGLYISFSGNVTYKGNDKIRESAKLCPPERILYETDSPYLAPIPVRGNPSTPECTEYTSSFLASLRCEEVDAFRKKAIGNFLTLLSHSKGGEGYIHPSGDVQRAKV